MTFSARSALLSVFALAALPLALGCSAKTDASSDPSSEEDDLSGTTYGDLMDTLTGADLDRWVAVKASLEKGFENICGDTLCSGDYSNLTTVRLKCSSTSVSKKLKACTWTLGGNIDYVDGATGKLTGDDRVWACPVTVSGTAKTMLDTLTAAGDKALQTPLASGKSFYDGLTTCFEGVVGNAPPTSTKTFYAELGDYLWNTGDPGGDAWEATKNTLNAQFQDVCGDTFCEGDFSDYSGLRFSCAVNANTKKVSRCTWTFAAAEMDVDAKGAIQSTIKNARCYVNVNALETDLRTALSGADPIHAKLPGQTTSIYDALVGCL